MVYYRNYRIPAPVCPIIRRADPDRTGIIRLWRSARTDEIGVKGFGYFGRDWATRKAKRIFHNYTLCYTVIVQAAGLAESVNRSPKRFRIARGKVKSCSNAWELREAPRVVGPLAPPPPLIDYPF